VEKSLFIQKGVGNMPRLILPNTCDRCQCVLSDDNGRNNFYGEYLCDNCLEYAEQERDEEEMYEDEEDAPETDNGRYRGVIAYSSKPHPEFHHRNDDGTESVTSRPRTFEHQKKQVNLPYLSCELEAEAPSFTDLDDEAARLGRKTNYLVYCKQDCSINYGFEIVSQPMTLDYIQNNTASFKDCIENLRADGWRAWDASNCGFHIHLEKKSFVDERHQMKFIYFVFNNKQKMVKFTGRNSSYASYDLSYFLNVNGEEWQREKPTILKVIKNRNEGHDPHYNRNLAVNIMPERTCELRVFKPSMRFSTLLAYFEFVHCLWAFTKDISTFDVVNKKALKSFDMFKTFAMDNRAQYSEFVNRANGRRIFEKEVA